MTRVFSDVIWYVGEATKGDLERNQFKWDVSTALDQVYRQVYALNQLIQDE